MPLPLRLIDRVIIQFILEPGIPGPKIGMILLVLQPASYYYYICQVWIVPVLLSDSLYSIRVD